MRRKSVGLRKKPVQRRSTETVATILEATARILERSGFEAFNTNAVAARAGVSVGSLYQYFPNKDALLGKLIEREIAPLLSESEQITTIGRCKPALRAYVCASIRHQMKRPRLAMLIDVAERREAFQQLVSGAHLRLQAVLEGILSLPDAPRVESKCLAASDLLAILRSLIDAAGERGETESSHLTRRVEGAVWGYLRYLARPQLHKRACHLRVAVGRAPKWN